MTQKDRKKIPSKYTWDLTTIFQNNNDFEASFKKVKELSQEAKKYQGQMAKNSKEFFGAITASLKAFRLLEKVYVYASLNNDLDISNAKYQAYNARVNRLASEVESDLAFIEPEILKMAPETVELFLKEQPDKQIYRHYLDFISQKRGHVLSESEESLISQAQDVFNSSAETFSVLSNSDLVFPEIVDEDGKKVQLSNGSYNSYIESYDRRVRKAAFQGIYQAYGNYQNTFAQTLAGQIKEDNYLAKVHHYPSARNAALAANNIPDIVYDNLIKTVHHYLPLLHRYMELRKKVLGLSEMHMYDQIGRAHV